MNVPCVVKIGGSLLDMPCLVERVARWLPRPAAIVTGGGGAADTVRHVDQQVALDEHDAHWLCIHAMALHARVLAAALATAGAATRLVADHHACRDACARGELAVIEPVAWLEHEQRQGAGVPHRWQFTSDSIAAHTAQRLNAPRLVLLKSTLPGKGEAVAVSEAVRLGVVDPCLPEAARGLGCVELVNLRDDALPHCRLVWE